MKLTLQRLFFTARSTCGELFIDNQAARFCYTLELAVRDGLPGSAIPPGVYQIELAPSPRFLESDDPWVRQYAYKMPHIIGIPQPSLIMLHWGNRSEDTKGCIVLGLDHDLDDVAESRRAFELLFPMIEGPALAGDCSIEIQGGGTPMVAPARLDLEGDA